MSVGFPFDDEPALNSQCELANATPASHNLSAALTGECNHEMLPARSVRRFLSMLTIRETLATEDFGRPVRREDNWTLPGARALPQAQATISSHSR